MPANKIAGQLRKTVVVILCMPIFERNAPPRDIPGFLQSSQEGRHAKRIGGRRCRSEEAHYRLLRPLRAHGLRPDGTRAEKYDELAPSHALPSIRGSHLTTPP